MDKELTIAAIAEEKGKSPSTVLRWIQKGLFPNAEMKKTPLGDYWVVPQSDLKNFELPTRGPKKKKNKEIASA